MRFWTCTGASECRLQSQTCRHGGFLTDDGCLRGGPLNFNFQYMLQSFQEEGGEKSDKHNKSWSYWKWIHSSMVLQSPSGSRELCHLIMYQTHNLIRLSHGLLLLLLGALILPCRSSLSLSAIPKVKQVRANRLGGCFATVHNIFCSTAGCFSQTNHEKTTSTTY